MSRSARAWALLVAILAPLSASSDPPASPENTRPSPRLLLIGDSFVAQSFGRALEHELSRGGFEVRRLGKGSTGLARPDFFDWWSEGARLVSEHDPEVVVVLIGGNDGQDLVDVRGRGRVRWGDAAWEERYAERVGSWVDALAEDRRTVLWLELPPMAGPRFERKVEYIRGVHRAALSRTAAGRYVPTGDFLRDSSGRARKTLTVNGAEFPLHQEDGVHLTVKAGWASARVVAKRILLDLEAPSAMLEAP